MTPAYVGDWTLARTITDLDADRELACRGTASLRDVAGALSYAENVHYRLAGKTIRATRAYCFRLIGTTIVANFAAGTPFFTLDLTADGTGSAIHQCGADRYELTLRLTAPSVWETRWDVTGAKRLTIETCYTRA